MAAVHKNSADPVSQVIQDGGPQNTNSSSSKSSSQSSSKSTEALKNSPQDFSAEAYEWVVNRKLENFSIVGQGPVWDFKNLCLKYLGETLFPVQR